MIKGIDVNQRIEFVSKNDTEEPKTIFIIRPLTGEEKANFQDEGKAEIRLSGTRMYDFLAASVVEIRNFNIEGDMRTKLNSIGDDALLAELIEAIGNLSNMTRQDQKN